MFQPRTYQSEAIEYGIFEHFRNNPDNNPLLVLPTGSGKSYIAAFFMREAWRRYPGTRIILATHVKELIEQDYNALMNVWPDAPAGIYSAGMRRRDDTPILFAGIQSIYTRAFDFDPFDLMIIDEAHTIPKLGTGRYLQFIKDLRVNNPYTKYIGLTATPYRMTSGLLTDGPNNIFDSISYEVTIQELLAEQYIAPLVSKNTKEESQIDLAGVHLRGGDYVASELAALYAKGDVLENALSETIERGQDRRSWLVFCCNVQHAEDACAILKRKEVTAECIHGGTPKLEREKIIKDFREGRIRCITNCMVLTTGFDAPGVDLIAFMRPTQSAGLYVQMAGRGMRIAPGKMNCLCLDFANLVATHGPVDSIRVRRHSSRGGSNGEVEVKGTPQRACPNCMSFCPISYPECPECGFVFPRDAVRHEEVASNLPILSKDTTKEIKPSLYDVGHVSYEIYNSFRGDCLLVKYYEEVPNNYVQEVSFDICREFIDFKGSGKARIRAIRWWRKRSDKKIPTTNQAAWTAGLLEELRRPEQIVIDTSGEYPKLLEEVW